MEAVVAAKPVITVAALCGSLRKGSFNRGLLRSAIQICNESINGIKIEYIEIAPLPMLNTDLEINGTFPPVVEAFRQKIREVDSVLFASPEYNYSDSSQVLVTVLMDMVTTDNFEEEEIVALNKGLTLHGICFIAFLFLAIVLAPLKNAIDWASRPPNVWADKAAAIVSAGGGFGGGRSQYHLRQIGVYIDLHFINKPEFFLNAFQAPSKFDSDGNLIDMATKERLKEVLLSLQAFTLRLQSKC
ncbi:hypothetical protein TEA_015075 [Camellia sinensis var. sinensis]|uniref:NAD(P)H dehydrogenase (quinone) n=1 Tax=Camellia sinensis var. sinensis TaxID=542762 RepID=A0A4V3WMF4_CAMSN|nr:hypothetical protein TEA_015075 [Camellia sinensis var. sinensis]